MAAPRQGGVCPSRNFLSQRGKGPYERAYQGFCNLYWWACFLNPPCLSHGLRFLSSNIVEPSVSYAWIITFISELGHQLKSSPLFNHSAYNLPGYSSHPESHPNPLQALPVSSLNLLQWTKLSALEDHTIDLSTPSPAHTSSFPFLCLCFCCFLAWNIFSELYLS